MPSFFLASAHACSAGLAGLQWALLGWAGAAAPAAQATAPVPVMYRCGQVYTNVPSPTGLCERLRLPAAAAVIEGTRTHPEQSVQAAPASMSAPAATPAATLAPKLPATTPVPDAPPPPQANAAPSQRERDAQARSLVAAELARLRQQHAQWQQALAQASPDAAAGEVADPARFAQRQARVQAALARLERDMAGAERELARRSVGTP